jgi:hypothetical protein
MSEEVGKEKKEKCKFDRDSLERLDSNVLNKYTYNTFIAYTIRDCFGFRDALIDDQLYGVFGDVEDQLYDIFGDDIILAVLIDAENHVADFVIADYSDVKKKWNIEIWRLSFVCPSSSEGEEEDGAEED